MPRGGGPSDHDHREKRRPQHDGDRTSGHADDALVDGVPESFPSVRVTTSAAKSAGASSSTTRGSAGDPPEQDSEVEAATGARREGPGLVDDQL